MSYVFHQSFGNTKPIVILASPDAIEWVGLARRPISFPLGLRYIDRLYRISKRLGLLARSPAPPENTYLIQRVIYGNWAIFMRRNLLLGTAAVSAKVMDRYRRRARSHSSKAARPAHWVNFPSGHTARCLGADMGNFWLQDFFPSSKQGPRTLFRIANY